MIAQELIWRQDRLHINIISRQTFTAHVLQLSLALLRTFVDWEQVSITSQEAVSLHSFAPAM